jgi:hypothetical protein
MAKSKISVALNILSIGLPSSGVDAITHCRRADWVDAAVIAGALPCNREFRTEYEGRADLWLNPPIVKLAIAQFVSISPRAGDFQGLFCQVKHQNV